MTPSKQRSPLFFVALVGPVALLLAALWYVSSLRPREIHLPISDNSSLEFSPDGQWLLYWKRGENAVVLRNLSSGVEREFSTRWWVSFRFSPDGRSFAFLSWSERDAKGIPLAHIELRSTTSGQLFRQFKGVRYYDNAYLRGRLVQFDSQGKNLLVAQETGVKVFPLDGSSPLFHRWPSLQNREIVAWSEKYWALEHDRDAKNHFLEIYDAQSRQLVHSLRLKRDYIQKASFSPDSRLLAVRDAQGIAGTPANDEGNRVIDVQTGQTLHEFSAPEWLFAPNNQQYVAQDNSQAQRLALCVARSGKEIKRLRAPATHLNLQDGAFAPDGKTLYAVDGSKYQNTIWKIRVD